MEENLYRKVFEWYSASWLWFIKNDNTGKVLKWRKNGRWYMQVQIKGKNHSVHRLVCLAFMWEDSRQVNHIDWNKENNKLSNLEYLTISENVQHAFKTGLRKSNLIWWKK